MLDTNYGIPLNVYNDGKDNNKKIFKINIFLPK